MVICFASVHKDVAVILRFADHARFCQELPNKLGAIGLVVREGLACPFPGDEYSPPGESECGSAVSASLAQPGDCLAGRACRNNAVAQPDWALW